MVARDPCPDHREHTQQWVRTLAAQPADGRPSGEILIPDGGVPVLASRDCLEVHYELGAEAGDAQS